MFLYYKLMILYYIIKIYFFLYFVFDKCFYLFVWGFVVMKIENKDIEKF